MLRVSYASAEQIGRGGMKALTFDIEGPKRIESQSFNNIARAVQITAADWLLTATYWTAVNGMESSSRESLVFLWSKTLKGKGLAASIRW